MPQAIDMQGWVEIFKKETAEHPVFLYVKGEKGLAVCGFSARVMQIFSELGADFEVRNILVDPAIRQALSGWTNWPTVPQVFVGGKFVGGCDIVTEMFQNGELKELVSDALQTPST